MLTLKDNLDYLVFLLTIMAAACIALYVWLKVKWLPKAGLALNAAAAVIMLIALIMRMQETGSLPVNSVYEFILFFSLVMLVFTLFWQIKVKLYGVAAFALIVTSILLGISFGLSDSATPLMPALQSN